MTNTNKMTKREVITMMLADGAISANEIYSAFLTHELELLNNKSHSKKPTKNQEQNKFVKAEILNTLEKASEPLTVTQVIKMGNFDEEVTNQKITSLLTQLGSRGSNEVVRTETKGKSYYSIAK